MTKQVPFIDREQELSQIEHAIKAWNTRRIFCINASGGIGKTRLLQEIYQRYTQSQDRETPLIVTNIIDFDDRTFHLAQNLGRHIATMLDEQVFERYLLALFDFRRMELAGVSAERLTQADAEITRTFIECFNIVSTQQRIVLLMDTSEALEGTDVVNYLLEVGTQFHNGVLVIAGRNARNLGGSFHTKVGADVQLIELSPLQEQSSELYLQRKQELMHVTLEPGLAQKLLFLAGGRPILIDLAVEWLAREIPLPWLVQLDLKSLKALTTLEWQQRQKEFERQLVHHIADTRQLIDWLILVMAWVYPLNGEMIATLLSISDAEANGLFEDAQNYVFVKRLPDGRIALHDEMRRMVNEYVWPEVDPDGDRRRRDSAIAVDYLEQEIQTLTTRITRLQEEEKTAHDAANAQGELNAFVTREPLERELWVLKRQQLVHMLFMDIGKGVKAFTEMFDEATRAYRFYFREALLNEMQRYATQLPPEQMYELKSRQVEFFLDHGSYTQARALATELLQQENLSLEQQVNMLIHRGNGEIRLGNLEKGRRDFDQAVQISQQADLKNWLVRAINARGWAYRNQGDFDLASADYLEAYQLSVQLNDRQQTAWILNNMGLVNAFKGDRDAAFENCQAALRLWEQIGFRRGMGATYSTLGRIYRRFDQLKNALESYSKALDIFESENDIDWINRVTCGKATVLWNLYNELQAIDPANAQKNLDQAEELFNWAFKHGPPNLKPWTLYNLAQIYRARKDFEAARQKFQECRKASREFDEDEREYRSFMRLIHLAWEIGEYNQWQEFAEEYKRLYAERSGGINFALRGTVLRRIADLAICEGKNYDAALNFYKEGLALITHYGIHQPYNYRIGPQLREIDEQLHECVPGNVLSNLGRDLAALWRDNRELITKYPDALLTFQRWEQEGGKA